MSTASGDITHIPAMSPPPQLRIIHVSVPGPGRSTYRGGRRIEDRLGRVIQFIEESAQRAVEREIEHQKELLRKEQVWHATRARAVARFAKKCKADALDQQLAQLQRATQIEDYVEAMRSRLDLTPEQKDWLDWVKTYGRASDPRYRDDIVPQVPEPSHEDLRPFMNGLNPYGPNLGW